MSNPEAWVKLEDEGALSVLNKHGVGSPEFAAWSSNNRVQGVRDAKGGWEVLFKPAAPEVDVLDKVRFDEESFVKRESSPTMDPGIAANEAELADVKKAIKEVEAEIKKLSGKIEAEELKPKEDRDEGLPYWREKKKQLREKENKLLDKEKRLSEDLAKLKAKEEAVPPLKKQKSTIEFDDVDALLEHLDKEFQEFQSEGDETPSPDLPEFGRALPFVGRTKFHEGLQEALRSYSTAIEKDDKSKENVVIYSLTGSPGIGKTRSLLEAWKYIQTETRRGDKFLPIFGYIDYANWKRLDSDISPELSLFLRLYHCCFLSKKLSFGDFWKKVKNIEFPKSPGLLLPELFEHLEKRKKKSVLLVLAIDEIQETLSTNGFFTALCRAIKPFVLNKKCQVIPFFAGTLLVPLQPLVGTNALGIQRLKLRPLTMPERFEVIEKVWPDPKHDWRNSGSFHHLVQLLGDVPRALSTLLLKYSNELATRKDFTAISPEKIIASFDSFQLPNDLKSKTLLDLVRLYYTEEKIPGIDHKPADSTFSFDELESQGLLMFQENQVILPKLMLQAILKKFPQEFPFSEQLFAIQGFGSHNKIGFESFYGHFLAFKLNLMLALGQAWTLRDFHRGATFFPEALGTECLLIKEPVRLRSMSSTFEIAFQRFNGHEVYKYEEDQTGFDLTFAGEHMAHGKPEPLHRITCISLKKNNPRNSATDKIKESTTKSLKIFRKMGLQADVILGVVSTGHVTEKKSPLSVLFPNDFNQEKEMAFSVVAQSAKAHFGIFNDAVTLLTEKLWINSAVKEDFDEVGLSEHFKTIENERTSLQFSSFKNLTDRLNGSPDVVKALESIRNKIMFA